MDKLTAIRTFVEVARTGKFGTAASVLRVPRARVSQRINDLEAHLGVKLINRTTRTMDLTAEGAAYFQHCAALLENLEQTERSLTESLESPSGLLRIEAVGSIARSLIAPNLEDFRKRYPAIKLVMSCSDRIVSLPGSGIDCAIRGGLIGDPSYKSQKLCSIAFSLYKSPRTDAVRDLADLYAARRIGLFFGATEKGASWRLFNGTETIDILPTDELLFDDTEAAINAAIAGCGIVVAPPFLTAHHLRNGLLEPVLQNWSAEPKNLYAIYPAYRSPPARLQKFIGWVEEIANGGTVS